MTKYLRIAFTGNTVVSPEYPDNFSALQVPLTALMPAARRARMSSLGEQIDAQLAYVRFAYGNLVLDEYDQRDADFKYPPDLRDIKAGLCIFESEELYLDPPPLEKELTFDQSPSPCYPTLDTTHAYWIARWKDFAAGGAPELQEWAVWDGDFVRVVIPAGHVSAGFVAEPIARINFDYGDLPETRPYAQEVVITLSYDDSVQEVSFLSRPFDNPVFPPPARLTFRWADDPYLSLLFGNGSLASIDSVLKSPIAGHDHAGDYDLEFEVTYDVMNVYPDGNGLLPLPRVDSQETLRVPCIAAMAAPPTVQIETAATKVSDPTTTDLRRLSRAERQRRPR